MVYPQENPEETTEDVFLRGTLTYEYGDAQTAFTQTRGTIEEALDSFAEGCQRLRTALKFRIKGDTRLAPAGNTEADSWRVAFHELRASTAEILRAMEQGVAIAEGVLGPPADRLVDARIATLEEQVRQLQRELGSAVR
jgi:hypothetical protein